MKHPLVYYAIDAAVISLCATICLVCGGFCWLLVKNLFKSNKRTTAAVSLIFLLAFRAGAQITITNTNTVTLGWKCRSNCASSFLISCTTNLLVPFTPVTTVQVTNPNQCEFTNQLLIVPGEYFFTCQASNMWGLSTTSNYAWTPPVFVPATNLSITRP